jgi:anti-sigma-K factor RskA
MNTSISDDDDTIRSAEYVLGLLDAAERRELESAMARDLRIAQRVAWWQRQFAPLAEDIVEVSPPARAWSHIRAELGFDAPAPAAAPRRPARNVRVLARAWDDLRLWRWIGIGASVAAAGLATVVATDLLREPQPAAGARGYLVANLAPGGGVVRWTATVDMNGSRVVIVPAGGASIARDRSSELWLIASGARPIALGLIAADHPTALKLSRDTLARMAPEAMLAVSVEPLGGSPSGQPTGPVIATGKVTGT